MNHFNFKSLAFYGVAISTVLVLFKTVTLYGDKSLHAPQLINNQYQLNFTKNLPNCQQIKTWQLNLQQSGIYLNAVLLPVTTKKKFDQHLTLTGILNNQKMSLSSKVGDFSLCQLTNSPTNIHHNITMQMSLIKKDQITGQLKIDSSSSLKFTGIPVTKQTKTSKLSSH